MFQLSPSPDQQSKAAPPSTESAKPAFFKPVIQPKLGVNQPGDVFEQEADEMPDRIFSPTANDHSFFKPAGNPGSVIQMAPVTGTQSTTAGYDLDNNSNSPRQVKNPSRTSAFPDAALSYDEGGSNFAVKFSLAWIFPHAMADAKRDSFVAGFESSVTSAWNDRYLLNESGTRRTAHVNISFDENVVHQMADDFTEAMALDKILKSKSVWLMDTRKPFVRDNVKGTTVELDQDANKDHSIKGSQMTQGAAFVIHDGNENKTFTQNTSAHEFGHMIGLADEYLNDDGTPTSQMSAARAHINDRIMNIGNNVTNDVYAPFADWLSTLTKTTWTVGRKVR